MADPGVYGRAQIDPPTPAAPRIDAPIPTDLQADLLNDGRVEFRFKAPAGGGAVFLVQQQIVPVGGVPGAFEEVGQADDLKRCIAEDVPTGVANACNRARTRLTNGQLSDWCEPATIRFGTAGDSGSMGLAA